MNLGKKYRAIFFDAGGTLFAPHPSVGEIYARVAGKYGMAINGEVAEIAFRKEFSERDKLVSREAHSNEKNEKEWWRNLVRVVFERVTEIRSFDPFFEELYDLFASQEVWKLYPDVLPVLRVLRKRKCILGIVSNWDSRLFSICRGMQIDQYFDFILASAVVGSAKPDSGIFKEALRKANVKTHEALHIGDSIENDIQGARMAGLDALLINRNGRVVENVNSVLSLEELLDGVENSI